MKIDWRAIVAALSLAVTVSAQTSFNSACFKGLNDADSPATLDSCDSPDLLNTESNLSGTAFLRRKGYSLNANLTISTSPVTGSHSFIDANGNSQVVVCQDRNCAKSTNGNAFAAFLTTAAAGITRWSFVDIGGVLYGGNNRYDPIMKWDGTTRTSPVGMPLGSILEATQDRLAIADISGNLNRVHYSSAGAYEQFTIGANPEDSYFDDLGTSGDRIRGMRYYNGNLYVFKTNSITLCELDDQYNSQCSVISPNIGTTDAPSIVTTGDALYFRGQDKNYWEITSRGITQISRKIPNLVKSQTGGTSGGENSNTQTSQSDWQNGTQSPTSTWNTVTTNGSIFPSSVTLLDNTTALWAQGSYSNNIDFSVDGRIQLTSVTVQDNWSNGVEAGRLAWTETGGDVFRIASNRLQAIDTGGEIADVIYTTSVTYSSGSWKMTYNQTGSQSCGVNAGSPRCWQMRVMTNAGGDYYSLQFEDGRQSGDYHNIVIAKGIAGTETKLTSVETAIILGVDYVFELVRSTDGRMFSYMDSVLISSTQAQVQVSSSTKFELRSSAPGGRTLNYDNFYFYQFASSGTIYSRIFDTAFTTPTWGAFSSTFTVQQNIEGQIVFNTRVSTSPNNDMWDSTVASSDTVGMTNAQKRYVRYEAGIATYISTKTPNITEVGLRAATTGQFYTQCIQPNSSISSWGTLSCSETKTGGGSLVYYTTSAASCATLPTSDPSSWQTTHTNNNTVTVSTNIAVRYGFRSLLGAATDQAQVDACTLSWTEGTPNQPAWGVYDSIKDSLYWAVTINNASSANRLLKYDRKLDSWYPFSIPMQAPKIINNVFYFGGASSGTWNTFGNVDNDIGGPIYAYRKTKDIGSDSPFNEKNFQKVSILTRNQGSGNMTVTHTLSSGKTGSYTVSLSTTSGLNYARSNYFLPASSPQNFINLMFSNNAANEPFEVLGLGVDYTVAPWKVSGP